MKRVGIAITLLVVVILMSVGSLILQKVVTDRLVNTCDELVDIYRRGDIEECRKKAQELSGNIEKAIQWFPFFLEHDRMEIIFQHAGALPYLVNADDPADFFSALAVIRVQLGILLNNEWPTLENIM